MHTNALQPVALSRQYLGAGLLYLIVVATGFFSLGYVPARTLAPGDPVATVHLLTSSEGLFRLGLLSDLILALAFLLLPFALHRLLALRHPLSGQLMVALAALSFPMALANLGARLDLLTAVHGGVGFPPLSGAALEAAVIKALQSHRHGLLLQQVCWGAWLIPLGHLITLGGLRPRALGYLLMVGGVGYLIHVFGTLGWQTYPADPLPKLVRLPATVAELSTCLALLAQGIVTHPSRPPGRGTQ